jgi:hypothetical protein
VVIGSDWHEADETGWVDYPNTQADSETRFATEAACRRYLVDL